MNYLLDKLTIFQNIHSFSCVNSIFLALLFGTLLTSLIFHWQLYFTLISNMYLLFANEIMKSILKLLSLK